jgi:uncharacterized membrane protein (UPF0136 family)
LCPPIDEEINRLDKDGEQAIMRAPGIVILLYGLAVLAGGFIAYSTAGSTVSLVAGSAFGLGLIGSGLGVLKGKSMGLFLAPLLVVVLIAYFGHRFLEEPELSPSGLMVALGLVTLILHLALRR